MMGKRLKSWRDAADSAFFTQANKKKTVSEFLTRSFFCTDSSRILVESGGIEPPNNHQLMRLSNRLLS